MAGKVLVKPILKDIFQDTNLWRFILDSVMGGVSKEKLPAQKGMEEWLPCYLEMSPPKIKEGSYRYEEV